MIADHLRRTAWSTTSSRIVNNRWFPSSQPSWTSAPPTEAFHLRACTKEGWRPKQHPGLATDLPALHQLNDLQEVDPTAAGTMDRRDKQAVQSTERIHATQRTAVARVHSQNWHGRLFVVVLFQLTFEQMQLWYNLVNFTFINKELCLQNNQIKGVIWFKMDVVTKQYNIFIKCNWGRIWTASIKYNLELFPKWPHACTSSTFSTHPLMLPSSTSKTPLEALTTSWWSRSWERWATQSKYLK